MMERTIATREAAGGLTVDVDDGARANRGESELNWLLDDFVDRVPGASSAAVVAADGLVLVISAQIPVEAADQLAAITSGLASLSDGAAQFFAAGKVRQLILEMDGGFLFVARVGDGSVLAVMCESNCDIGLVGYEMSLLIGRIGHVLTPELRAKLLPPANLSNVMRS
jgi:predicted regulator of Ras-like GTPase activity (Roadblock/LC7/MglB family)